MTPILRVPSTSKRRTLVPWLLAAAVLLAGYALRHNAVRVATRVPLITLAGRPEPQRLPIVVIRDLHSLDAATIGTKQVLLIHGVASVAARRGAIIAVTGWAVDATAGAPSAGVFAIVGRRLVMARSGLARPDVARVLGSAAYAMSGFELDLPTSTLPNGRSAVAFWGENARGTGRYKFHRTLLVTVVPATGVPRRLRR